MTGKDTVYKGDDLSFYISNFIALVENVQAFFLYNKLNST